jgi:hypothetical protein
MSEIDQNDWMRKFEDRLLELEKKTMKNCCMCGKRNDAVKILCGTHLALICNECIAHCCNQVAEAIGVEFLGEVGNKEMKEKE